MAHAQHQTSVLRFFFKLIWQHKYKCLAMSILNIAWGLGEAFTPYLLKLVIDALNSPEGARAAAVNTVWWLMVGIVALMFIKHTVQRITDVLTEGYIGPQIQGDIRLNMLEYAMGHSYRYYQKHLSGSIADRIDQVAQSFQKMYEGWEHWIMPVMWSFVFSIIILWQTHVVCALMVLAWLVVSMVLSAWLSVNGVIYARDHAMALNKLIGNMVNVVQNIFTVKMFAQQQGEKRFIGKLQQKEIDAVCSLEWFLLRVRTVLSLTCICLLGGLMWFLLYGWQEGFITVGDITLVLTTCFNMLNTIWWLSSHLTKLYKEYGISKQAFRVMSKPHQIMNIPGAKKLAVKKGEIVFNDVHFNYKHNPEIFEHLTLTIKAGEKVGLVGFSGSGKSTFVHLIMRFFDVSRGSISIDGQDISKVTQDSLRKQIALIPQEPMLFARTVTDNLKYAAPDASPQKVKAAVRKAHADFIDNLPYGFDTVLGERGANLSGGQRQRLAIARAILKDAPVLILDEATSALDSVTERYIQESLDKLMKGRTAIVIAHRLSTLQNMDRLLVFEDGMIVEQGTHAQLLDKGDHYARLWQMQVGGVLPSDEALEEDEDE